MKYISPFAFFSSSQLEGIHSFEDISYPKLRKRLLAKYELNNNEAIKIGDDFVNKSEALTVLEELTKEPAAAFHIYVHQNETLMNFLSAPTLDHLLAVRDIDESAIEGRKRYLSKFFATNLNELMKWAFKNKHRKTMRRLYTFDTDKFILSIDKDLCYGDTYQAFNKQITILENMHTDFSSGSTEMKDLMDDTFDVVTTVYVDIVNFLPDYFLVLRNKLAKTLQSISIDIYNKGERGLGEKLIHLAVSLEAEHDTRKSIMKTRDEVMMNG